MELLQAIGDMIDKKLDAKLDAKLEPINNEVQSLGAEIKSLGSEIKLINQRLEKVEQVSLKNAIALENTIPKTLDLLLEGQDEIREKFRKQEKLEHIVENHGDRIFALEQVVKAKAQ